MVSETVYDGNPDGLDRATLASARNLGSSCSCCCSINRVPLKYTLRNLTVRWITTALTLVAFVIVIGLMVVMLAFTTGMKRMTEGTGEPTNVLGALRGRRR